MAVSDWSTTAGSNTIIAGVNIGEGCPAGNMNNGLREAMAELRTVLTDFALTYLVGTDAATTLAALGAAPASGATGAIGALTPAADRLPYFSGTSTAALATLTSFARSLLAEADAASMRSLLGAMWNPTISGGATSGSVLIGPIALTWRDWTFSGEGGYAYGNAYAYSSWARAWVAGTIASQQQTNPPDIVGTPGLSSATIYTPGSPVSGTLFAIGV